jgi:hypothetical protein
MSASPVHDHKPTARCVSVLSPFLRHVNTGSLAFVLFVALALLSTTRGREAETRESAPAKVTTSEVIIKGGQRTIRDLDFTEKETLRQLAHN